MPAEQMMKLTPPVSVHWLQVSEAGMIVPADYYGRTETVPWPSVFVISGGFVAKAIEDACRTTRRRWYLEECFPQSRFSPTPTSNEI